MLINTLVAPLVRLWDTNVVASSMTAKVPTISEPQVGAGIIKQDQGQIGNNQAVFAFFGTRSSGDNETMTAIIYGWRKIGIMFIPTPLLALTITLGTATGVAGQAPAPINTEYFADTIVASTEYSEANELISPANNTVALVKVDTYGCSLISVDLAKGTCASANALGAPF